MLCVVISLNICYNPNLFYVSYFNFFLKFIVHKINSEMVKHEMVVLTRREKADVTEADRAVGWIL
jgi:hypothetical protein